MRYFVLVNDYKDFVSLPIKEQYAKATDKSPDEKWYELVEVNQETLEREEQ